jgi:hypothetical protein
MDKAATICSSFAEHKDLFDNVFTQTLSQNNGTGISPLKTIFYAKPLDLCVS